MSKFYRCPTCGNPGDGSVTWVYRCNECGHIFCDRCGGGHGTYCNVCGKTNISHIGEIGWLTEVTNK